MRWLFIMGRAWASSELLTYKYYLSLHTGRLSLSTMHKLKPPNLVPQQLFRLYETRTKSERRYFVQRSFLPPGQRVVVFHSANAWNSSAWTETRKASNLFFWSVTRPPLSVYPGRHWHHSCDETDQPFPTLFLHTVIIKTLTVRRDWSEAAYSL